MVSIFLYRVTPLFVIFHDFQEQNLNCEIIQISVLKAKAYYFHLDQKYYSTETSNYLTIAILITVEIMTSVKKNCHKYLY